MKKLAALVLGIMLFVSIPAFAIGSIGTDDINDTWNQLTPTQQAEMAAMIAKEAEAAQTPALPAVSPDKVEPWFKLIDRIGDGLVKLAHDLGVEANQLIKTPVGMLAMGLIVYHVAGDDILEIFLGLLWFFLIMPFLTFYFFKSVIPIKEYVEVTKRTWWGAQYTAHKPIRRQMTFGEQKGCGPDWVFLLLFLLNIAITLCILV